MGAAVDTGVVRHLTSKPHFNHLETQPPPGLARLQFLSRVGVLGVDGTGVLVERRHSFAVTAYKQHSSSADVTSCLRPNVP